MRETRIPDKFVRTKKLRRHPAATAELNNRTKRVFEALSNF
jgi:hypothetical protein